MSKYSLFRLDAASARNGFFYTVDFGVEGSWGSVLIQAAVIAAILLLNRGRGEKEDLWKCYPEFVSHEKNCRFAGCSHISEPDCGIKTAVGEGKISQVRYENYRMIYNELSTRKKY